MNNKDQIKTLKEKIAELKHESQQLGLGLQDNADKIKKVEAKIQTPYSGGFNLFMIILCFAITCGVGFLLLKWWMSTGFSTFVGVLFFIVAIISLIWDVFIVVTSTKKHHDKEVAQHQKTMEELLHKKEEIIAKKNEIHNEIKNAKKAIDDIKLLQEKEKEEKRRKLEEKERQRKAKLETRFQKVINSEKIDRKELKVIADAGHSNARVEMAKILIDDYFSKTHTKEEKEQLASTAQKYLKDINNEKNVEVELLELFSYTMSSCLEGGTFMKANLKKIKAIKNVNTLSEKYDSLANNMIQHIESVIEEHDHREGSSINYSYSTKNDDASSSLCAYYQNGCCKRGYNANYNISCGYSEYFHSVCPNYQKR